MKDSNKVNDLIDFLNRSPTAWHAVDNLKTTLLSHNFIEINEKERWSLKKGGRYFVSRNGSSLCAFIVPQNPQKAVILGSHTDSPALKLKPNAEFLSENMRMLGVEVYGGPLLNSWLNRDLGIAGRLCCLSPEGKITEKLVNSKSSPVVIPQLAIHLDRTVNETGLILNKQEHLSALAGLVDSENPKKSYLESLFKKDIGSDILLSHDLFLYPVEEAHYIGQNKEMLSSYRIDNLCSVHASLDALTSYQEPENQSSLAMAIFWDHEEIGSSTAQGADSPFLTHILERILLSLDMDRESYFTFLNRSLCVSVDLGHALNPNYKEKSDARHNLLMNQGIIIKTNAQQRYATDARSSAEVLKCCHDLNIPYQKFISRNDTPCGSTIGPITASLSGISTVDIGIAQLSMHSCRELIGCQDHIHMCRLLKGMLEG